MGFSAPAPVRGAVAKAIQTVASQRGVPIADATISIMLAQMVGAEGAMPGQIGGDFAGTNNPGCSQVGTASFVAGHTAPPAKAGWGACAHVDNIPGATPNYYLGWYVVCPSVLDAITYWITNTAVRNALQTTDVATYAQILKSGSYYGVTADQYAAAITNGGGTGLPVQSYLAAANDPTVTSVAPSQFSSLLSRAAAGQSVEALYNKAVAGGMGSSWKNILGAYWPTSYAQLVERNGIVFFGTPPGGVLGGVGGAFGTIATGLGLGLGLLGGLALAHAHAGDTK